MLTTRARLSDYGGAIANRPGDPRLRNIRGWAYLRFDSPKLALFDFEAALKIDPADPNAYSGRGTAIARLGDHRAAVADARQVLALGKTNPRLTYEAARIYALAASARRRRPRSERRVGPIARRQLPGHRPAINR